jgi:hypothetical protein
MKTRNLNKNYEDQLYIIRIRLMISKLSVNNHIVNALNLLKKKVNLTSICTVDFDMQV